MTYSEQLTIGLEEAINTKHKWNFTEEEKQIKKGQNFQVFDYANKIWLTVLALADSKWEGISFQFEDGTKEYATWDEEAEQWDFV